MTTTMQIYLTILVIASFIAIVTIIIGSVLNGYYYYEKYSGVFYYIAGISFFFILGWVLWIGIALIWHLY